MDQAGPVVTVWEPCPGTVVAQLRDPRDTHRPGGRAYLSAGCRGRVVGSRRAVDFAERADVDLNEVRDFFTTHGLWEGLT